MSKWMDLLRERRNSISQGMEPSEPTEPTFVGFVGDFPRETEKIICSTPVRQAPVTRPPRALAVAGAADLVR
jgi:hypothetical protein